MSPGPAQGREYPPEVVWRAQELYCVARLPYHEVAQHVGVAASTLKRWGKEYEWADKRAELAQAEADIRADTVLARAACSKN
jgi:transposase-like protein